MNLSIASVVAQPPAWQIVVHADPAHHADTDAWALPGTVRVPFPAGHPQRTIAHGDRVHLGAWTTLTLRQAGR